MAISSISELRTAVTNWLERDDISSDRVNEFIALAEARIGRRLRVRGVEDRATTALVVSQEYYSLPSDFLEARNVQINTNPVTRLKYLTPEQMDYQYSSTTVGPPKAFTIIGEEIQLKPIPNATDTMEISYYKKLAALTDSNTTNWLTTNAPDLLLYGALIEAETYLINDPRTALWKSAFDVSMNEWNTQDAKGRHSGSALRISSDSGNP